jgi:hypothetical protein
MCDKLVCPSCGTALQFVKSLAVVVPEVPKADVPATDVPATDVPVPSVN